MQTRYIFIGENEDKNKVFDKLTDKLDIAKFKSEFKDISKKIYNNKVGYYLFKDGNIFYKIFVLPKYIDLNQTDNEIIIEFIDYLKIFFSLKSKYKKYNQVDELKIKSTIELSFDSVEDNFKSQDVEIFTYYKYITILQNIENFFKNHKANKKIKQNYISQSLKYKLDLKANLKELDKTKIHQSKFQDIIYSTIATIVYGVIKLFIRKKSDLFRNEKLYREILQKSTRIKNLLLKKYVVDKSFALSLNKLISTKSYKIFRKKEQTKILYNDVLSLFGLEHFFDETNNKDINRNIKTDAIFFAPELMYEWYVYDRLINQYDKENVQFDKEEGTSKKYKIDFLGEEKTLTSNPDFIVKYNNQVYVIDAKWKILEKVPDLCDILKLKRDCELRSDYSPQAVLIYIKTKKGLYQEYFNDNTNSSFNTKLIQIDGLAIFK